jgi:hypothetical protein
MATETQLTHYERINQITRYIRKHRDEPLNRDELAQRAGFSVPHFHRIFTWLPTSGEALRDAIPFEDYVDDPSQTTPEQLRTDIYVPIQ